MFWLLLVGAVEPEEKPVLMSVVVVALVAFRVLSPVFTLPALQAL